MADKDEGVNEEEEAKDGEGGEEGSEGEGGEKGGRNWKKLAIFIAVPIVVIIIGIGGALYFTGFFSPKDPAAQEQSEDGEHGAQDGHDKKDAHAKKKKSKGGHGGKHDEGDTDPSTFLAMPPINVNLQSEGGQARFLRLSVALELEDPDDKEAVEAVLPRVIDAFQTYLRELRVEDLRGSAGLYRLQIELLWRVNQAAAPVHIKDVLFQEILIN